MCFAYFYFRYLLKSSSFLTPQKKTVSSLFKNLIPHSKLYTGNMSVVFRFFYAAVYYSKINILL